MTQDDFATVWRMVTGVWPRMDTPETAAAWWGLIGHHAAQHATSSVRRWASERRSAPTPADIIEGMKIIAAEQRVTRPAIGGGTCDECDGEGFVWTDLTGHGTVKRCRRGCMPPTTEERRSNQHHMASTGAPDYIARLAAMRNERAAHRARIGDAAWLRQHGFDPAAFVVRDGMVVARPR